MDAVVVHSRQLRYHERVFLYHLLVRQVIDHPIAAYARSLPYEHIAELMRVMALGYEIKFGGADEDLRKFQQLHARQLLYQRLLTTGAPARLLHRHFSKSHRQISRDRKIWGRSDKGRGRPRTLSGELAYEISGRWDSLRLDEPDFARRFALLSEFYPAVAMSSLYALLGQFI